MISQSRFTKLLIGPWVVFLIHLLPQAYAGALDQPIDYATERVVKLYGLGAGVQAGFGTGTLVSDDGKVLTVFSLLIDAHSIRAVTADGKHYVAEVIHRDPNCQLALLQLKPEQENHAAYHDGDIHQGKNGKREVREGSEQESLSGTMPLFISYFDVTTGLPRGSENEIKNEVESETQTDAPQLEPGDWVIAAGNAFKVAEGQERVSITHGVFSIRTLLDARRRVREFPYQGDVLVIDAITSNPGAPGGAVVDLQGRLVGMVGRVVMSNLTHTHFNYAIPRDVLAEFYQEALDPARAHFTKSQFLARLTGRDQESDADAKYNKYGIRMARTGYRKVLPFVQRIKRNSPAEQAGLRPDDLILSVNGKNVSDVDDFDQQLAGVSPDALLSLVIRRGRSILNLRVEPLQVEQTP